MSGFLTEDEIAALAAALPRGLPAFDDGVEAQATRELQGVNMILGTYGLGQVPPYPAIDGAGKSAKWDGKVDLTSKALLDARARNLKNVVAELEAAAAPAPAEAPAKKAAPKMAAAKKSDAAE